MVRQHLAKKHVGEKEGFRWRSHEISRFEGLSDAVFGFAITLLIVSLEVPHTFDELLETMRGFGAFAICFALLIAIWYKQYIYFRRYGLEDTQTILLNSVLLFVVLFYVYPLKFLFSLLFNSWLGLPTDVHLPDGRMVPPIRQDQLPLLMIIYSLGFAAASLVFIFLYRHAWKKRVELELNELERLDTRASVFESAISLGVGAASVSLAALGGAKLVGWAGWIYPVLLAPAQTFSGMYFGRQRRKVWERMRVAAD
ncbi:MAG: TMEM175 family protein [Candidatus Acidiferrales bacterium]